MKYFLPVMTCAQARAWEKRFFDPLRERENEPPRERDFMQAAGTSVAETILRELNNRVPAQLLVLIGKGHNGGDAIIAANQLLARWQKNVPVKFVFFANDWDALAPLTMDVYEDFLRAHGEPNLIFYNEQTALESLKNFCGNTENAVVLDGIYGYNFRAPLREHVFEAFIWLNKNCSKSLRVAIDLPSGLSDIAPCGNAFLADLTCAVGILKSPLLVPENAPFVGKIVPCAIGFSCEDCDAFAADSLRVLDVLKLPRQLFSDKRDYGKILIVGGSRRFAGALMMNVLAALRAGTGLVTAFCPESVHAAFVARAPAAMWIPCKETSDGDLDFADVAQKLDDGHWLDGKTVQAILCGSGLGRSRDALAIAQKIAAETCAPTRVVFDADAIVPEVLNLCQFRKNRQTFILPHAGELARVAGTLEKNPITGVVKKSHFTWVCVHGEKPVVCCAGTPVLARGGSGDLLAGTVVSLLAQFADENIPARDLLAIAVCWHGLAGQALAREQGEHCADIAALPNFFNVALNS